VAYAFHLRSGLIRFQQMPQYGWDDRPLEVWLKKPERSAGPAVAPQRHVSTPSEIPPNLPWNPQIVVAEADRMLNGELKYFAHQFVKTGFPPNWHKDHFGHVILSPGEGSLPEQLETHRSSREAPLLHTVSASPLGGESDTIKHWSQIPDDSNTDIKFIWEPNRFAFVYTLVRAYAASHDEKYAEAFWQSILDWAEHNPPNTGPNWMDGQEIALRLMAWTFGFAQFSGSPSSTAQRIKKFTLYVAAQAERIHKNIGYAISTRSNHTISEAFGLWLVGLLFPELKDSEKYLSLGRKLLEQAAAAQILPDGSYSMYSLNYQRFILHIYLYAIRLGEINHFPLSSQLKESVANSIAFLSHLIDPQTGQIPVYGSNDGALVLPLNNCDFTDYRPLLQLGWYITRGECLFEPGEWDEDLFWLCGFSRAERSGASRHVVEAQVSKTSFPDGGLYLLRNRNSKAIIRCTDFRSRPSHADQLHVDLWMRGQNIACDAGTYLYSGHDPWRNGLAHTSTHNTVTVDGKDQMTLVSRFTWTNWSKGKVLRHTEKLWQGEHDGYKPVAHRRTVMALEDDRWLVIDDLVGHKPHHYALHWLLDDSGVQERRRGAMTTLPAHGLLLQPLDDKPSDSKILIQVGMLEGRGDFSVVRADPGSTRGWRSRYYGHREPAISLMLEAHQPQVAFWTFFGFEEDIFEVERKEFKLNSKMIPLVE
jgi:asparagine synthase (glutamine-hydrolysing)